MKLSSMMGVAAIAIASVLPLKSFAEELSVANFVPPQHHTNAVMFKWFADEVTERSGGSLTIKVYPAGQIGAGPVQQYKRAVGGVADTTFGIQAYTPAIFPKSMLIIPPGKATNAREATKRLLAVYDDHLADEYEDVKLLGIFTTAGNVWAATSDVSTLDDLAGETFSFQGAASFDGADAKSVEMMKSADQMAKVAQIEVSAEERAKMDAAVAEGLEDIFADYEARGISDARAIYEAIDQ